MDTWQGSQGTRENKEREYGEGEGAKDREGGGENKKEKQNYKHYPARVAAEPGVEFQCSADFYLRYTF